MGDVHDLTGAMLAKEASDVSLAEKIGKLTQAAACRDRPVPARGDLVTLTPGLLYQMEAPGIPLVVLDVLPPEKLMSVDFANVRVGYVMSIPQKGSFISCVWLEHWCLEPYVRAEGEK